MRKVTVVRVPGRVPYEEGLRWQRALAAARIDGRLGRDVLLLLEHSPVLTVGRGAKPEHLRFSAAGLEAQGIRCVEVERGGDVTYHGPGQLVGYPILDLRDYEKDLHWYMRALERALIEGLAGLGLRSRALSSYTGVWVGSGLQAAEIAGTEPAAEQAIAAGALRKIASIGVHVSRWVTSHGFALNMTKDALGRFDFIVPCGIPGVRMTSLESEGVVASREAIGVAVVGGFSEVFGARLEDVSLAELSVGTGTDLVPAARPLPV